MPPELFTEIGDGAVENASPDDWEKAIEYHEIKRRIPDQKKRESIRASAIKAIIRRAMATMGAISRPQKTDTGSWENNLHGELDLESSIEADPHLSLPMVETKSHKKAEVLVCIDTSLSMTGKKLALTAVSLATIALQLDAEDLAVVAFETEAELIKALGKPTHLSETLKRFLEVPARGLTNIESGLKMAFKEAKRGKQKKQAIILMTDGRFTAGKSPEYLIKNGPKLHVVQTGNAWSSPRFCRNLARLGGGKHMRVSKPEHLPKALYSLVHEIVR